MDSGSQPEPVFVEDIYPRQMLYALTIRSPVAAGRLKSIECPRLPNIYTLITAKDIPGRNRLEDSPMPILAGDALSYIGEPVALLLGPDRNMLEEYAAQITVAAEEEPPVFAPGLGQDGLKPDGLKPGSAAAEDRVLARREIRIGEPEAAFKRAASVTRDDYRTGIQEHWYAEPVGAVVWLEDRAEDDGAETEKAGRLAGKTLVVRTATQWPFHVKRSLAQALKLEPARVRVEPTNIALHMDGKLWYPSLIACHAALGACITKKPVRLLLTREEDFRYSPKRAASEISVSSALDENGGIIAAEITVTVNMGAYGVNAAEILDQCCLGSLGLYRCEAVTLSGAAVRTNIPPQGAFSGFGLAQGLFAAERHISHIADMRGENPAEWRKGHFLKTGLLPLGLPVKDAAPGDQLLDAAASMSDYYRKWAAYELLRQGRRRHYIDDPARTNWAEKGERLRGIGIALGYQGNGLLYPGVDRGSYGIELTLEKDGGLEIKTSALCAGGNCRAVWSNIAAEILSIEAAAVRIVNGANAPDSGPATSSRNSAAITRLVEHACVAIRKQRFRDPLPITVRRGIKPLKSPVWEERFPPPDGRQLDAGGFVRPGWASAVVEVEIDPIEYIPKIRGVWLGVDGGKILSEDRARRSLTMAAAQALGWAYRERAAYTDGVLPAEQFEQYDIPSPGEIPPITIDFIWNSSGEAKGIGDLPFTCIPAAYLQAVSQAMDHHFHAIPLRALDILEAGKLKQREELP
jgi:CO/xanthine dehydrogenase Mo-binding subunit